jgi:ring-1,2-phenylacetyl-CoA epoxidase subunit PaaC
VTSPTRKRYHRVEELGEKEAAALLEWGLCLADTKQRIGIRTSEWVNGGPALEAAVGASAITQDELGHARSLYAMLRDFPGAPESIGAENDLEARDVYYCPRLLNESWSSWLDVIVVNVLLDRVTSLAVAAADKSTFGPLKGRTAKILQEEAFHRIFGDSWLAKLAKMNDEQRDHLQDSINRFWKMTVGWFGPDDDMTTLTLYEAGILRQKPHQLRQRWLDDVVPLLEEYDFVAPSSELDWSGWHSPTREVA